MTTVPAETLRTRTFSWTDPVAAAGLAATMDGLSAMRAIAAGELPPPPIASLLDMELVEVDAGRAVFRLHPAEWMYNPIGTVHGGIAATLLDSCMGCAVHTTLPAGVGYTTTDLQVRYLGAMGDATGPVLAIGTVVHAGGRIATAEARLITEDGQKVLAHGTTGCLILRPR